MTRRRQRMFFLPTPSVQGQASNEVLSGPCPLGIVFPILQLIDGSFTNSQKKSGAFQHCNQQNLKKKNIGGGDCGGFALRIMWWVLLLKKVEDSLSKRRSTVQLKRHSNSWVKYRSWFSMLCLLHKWNHQNTGVGVAFQAMCMNWHTISTSASNIGVQGALAGIKANCAKCWHLRFTILPMRVGNLAMSSAHDALCVQGGDKSSPETASVKRQNRRMSHTGLPAMVI